MVWKSSVLVVGAWRLEYRFHALHGVHFIFIRALKFSAFTQAHSVSRYLRCIQLRRFFVDFCLQSELESPSGSPN